MNKKIMGIMIPLVAIVATLTFLPFKGKVSAEQTISAEKNQIDLGKVSESFGHLIAKHLQNPGLQLDMERIIKGMREELAGLPSPMTEQEYEIAIAQIQENVFKEISDKNLGEATTFLEKNFTEEGVIALETKLQYKVLKQGEGNEVTQESTPLIHYTGKLLDGTVFGNSYEQQEPIPLPISHTIPGFSKGLVGMKEGEQRRLFIHPDLAYGVNGQLPPNSLLIFDVEIVKNEVEAEVEGSN